MEKLITLSKVNSLIADSVASTGRGRLTTFAEYLSGTQVRIPKGDIEINGEVYQVTSPIDFTASPTALSWHVVYAQAPSSGDIITSSEISISTTMPTKDDAKGGWYDSTGLKRAIGLAYTGSGGNFTMWQVNGGVWSFHTGQQTLYTTSAPTVWTQLTVSPLPSLGIPQLVLLRGQVTAAAVGVDLLVANGIATPGGNPNNRFAETYSSTETGTIAIASMGWVITNASNQAYYACSYSGTVYMFVYGFILPAGLRRTN